MCREGFPPELLAELHAVDPRHTFCEKSNAELEALLALPGCWKASRLNFVLVQSYLNLKLVKPYALLGSYVCTFMLFATFSLDR